VSNSPATNIRASSIFLFSLLLIALSSATPAFSYQAKSARDASTDGKRKRSPDSGSIGIKSAKPEKNSYDYTLPGSDGKDVPLSSYKGKFILIVNLARKSSYGTQLPALIKLNDTYKDKGLVVIGIPSNDFGASEPGTDAEIQKYYIDAKTDFPIMAVSKLSGDDEIPFFLYLTKSKDAPAGGPVHWNYTKFFIDKNGKVLARLNSDVTPDSPEMLSTVDQILLGTYKPKKESSKDSHATSDDDDDD
jgi:glutathione peroxidase